MADTLRAPNAGADASLDGVRAEEVMSAARAALKMPSAEVVSWRHERIRAGVGYATAGTYRVLGTAQAHGRAVSWSAVLKVLRPSTGPDRSLSDTPAHWRNWRREAFVYASEAAAGIPGGFGPARCFGVTVDGAEARLWLEEVTEKEARPWPAARLRLTAQHFGRFQGAFGSGRPLPAEEWLPRDWLRQYVEACAPYVAWLVTNATHPLAQRLWPEAVREEALRLWEERHALLAVLDGLPQTLRHGDMNVGNLFARQNAQGEAETVAIDWAFAAQGAIGEDLAGLLRPRNQVREGVPPDALRDLVVGGYLDGLRDAGCLADVDAITLGYVAGAALRDCFHTLVYEYLLDAGHRAALQARIGLTEEALIGAMGRRIQAGIEHAREARALLAAR